jgi:hypothetical protein
MKIFKLKEKGFGTTVFFNEKNAPTWLTSENTVKDSTMDMRWFWEKVLNLEVGETIDTDFYNITRILEVPEPSTVIEKNESVRRSAIFQTMKKDIPEFFSGDEIAESTRIATRSDFYIFGPHQNCLHNR